MAVNVNNYVYLDLGDGTVKSLTLTACFRHQIAHHLPAAQGAKRPFAVLAPYIIFR
jgi:hypothetical protein